MSWPEALDPETVLKTDRWIRNLARGLVSSEFDADDVIQETWLAALRKSFRADLPRAWMARVLSNVVRKRHRSSRRRKQRESLASRPECAGATPEEAIERAELRRQLIGVVMELREPYRSTIVLRFFEDMRLQQIARAQGIPVNTVKTRLCRGLGFLKTRLDGIYKGRGAWSMVLLPVLATGSSSSPSTSGIPAILKQTGVASMSAKTAVSATCISIVVVVGLGLTLPRIFDENPGNRDQLEKSPVASGSGGRPEVRETAVDREEKEDREDPAGLAAVDLPSRKIPAATRDPAPVRRGDGEDSVSAKPASAEVLAMRETYRAIRKAFGEGGMEGWKAVGKRLALLDGEETFLDSEEGFAEFLALIDSETDASFLEALLHHIPMAMKESRRAILEDRELQDEIWARFEEADDPPRRMAFLRFFAFNRKLNATRMDAFLEVARTDPSPIVRQLGIDAIASNRDLSDGTWETLAEAAENDPSLECRNTAIYGLALRKEERAARLVKAAFSSPQESTRAAALLSEAGDEIPPELTGGDPTAYLVNEFRAASSREYKKALVRRLFERSPRILKEELLRAIPEEKNWLVKKDYRAALKQIADLQTARTE